MKSKDWLILSIITFLTVLSWTVYDVYHTVVTSTITPVDKELVKPISPEFDGGILFNLQQKEE